MTDNEKRIAIAKFCGWEVHHCGRYCSAPNCGLKILEGTLFDPLEDLNAMHLAEDSLDSFQTRAYGKCLWMLTNQRHPHQLCRKWHATAMERADTFLIVIKKTAATPVTAATMNTPPTPQSQFRK